MFQRKKIKKPPILNYPHKFSPGDLLKPKYPIQNPYIKDELAVILSVFWKDGHQCAEIILQDSSTTQVITLPRLILCYEKA